MNYIGKVIKELRLRNGISRKELADNICTEKYIYLIEKGERTPSVEMAVLFNIKLGIDLFEYYDYLSAETPVKVYEVLEKMNEFRRTMNFEELKRITDESLKFEDFHQVPWSYEMELNRFSYKVFVEQKWEESITEIKKILGDIEIKNETEKYYVNLCVLLSTCYQMGGDLINAEKSTLKAYEILGTKLENKKYRQEITSVNQNLMSLYYFLGKYEESIKIGLRQIRFQAQTDSYEQAHYTYFYLSYAYFESEMEEEAFKWFEKGFSHINTSEKHLDAYYISTFKSFHEMIGNKRTRKEQVQDFLNKFKIYEFNNDH